MNTADRMRLLRAQYGATQQQCATALGIAQPSYAAMEAGKVRVRRRDMVALAVLYGVDPVVAFPGDCVPVCLALPASSSRGSR
jgi:transcriptional regulator with XRE-family HTH domain